MYKSCGVPYFGKKGHGDGELSSSSDGALCTESSESCSLPAPTATGVGREGQWQCGQAPRYTWVALPLCDGTSVS